MVSTCNIYYFTPGMSDISTVLEPTPITSRHSSPPASASPANSNTGHNSSPKNNENQRDEDASTTLQTSATICTSKVCGDRVDVVDSGDEVAEWLRDALCRFESDAPRLLRINPKFQRVSSKKSMAASMGNRPLGTFLAFDITSSKMIWKENWKKKQRIKIV